MRSFRIVADSSSDMMNSYSEYYGTAPLKIITKEREFCDDDFLDVGEMVEFLSKYNGKSQTSCPSIGDWIDAFGGADDVFCITITSGLSGSYNSACSAKQIYESENPGKRVFVLDSLSTGPEIALCMRKICEYVEDGLEFGEICDRITKYSKTTGLLFMLKSLTNLANNGRVNMLVAKIAKVVGICMVGRASDVGTLEPLHKCFGEGRALSTIVSELSKRGYAGGRVSIAHCDNDAAAKRLESMITDRFPGSEIEIHPLRGLCSFYAERGGVLVGFEKG